ncbi:MAG: PAAR domain-containing protein [Pirellulaceae bacterium]
MGLPAARITDVAGHGGIVAMGSPTVFIGGLMAARVGDPISCPATSPQPHGVGNITVGSTSVVINGAFAARMTDPTSCSVPGVSGVGRPSTQGIPGEFAYAPPALVGVGRNGFLVGDLSGHRNNGGTNVKGKVSLAHLEGSSQFVGGDVDAHAIEVEGTSGLGAAGLRGKYAPSSAQIAVDRDSNTAHLIGQTNAELGVDFLAGTDGRRIGYALGGVASVGAGVDADVESVLLTIPLLNISIYQHTTVGGGGGVGGESSSFSYYDRKDGRFHFGFLSDIKLLFSAKFGEHISIGAAPSGVGVPAIPGIIASGCPNVFIGG